MDRRTHEQRLTTRGLASRIGLALAVIPVAAGGFIMSGLGQGLHGYGMNIGLFALFVLIAIQVSSILCLAGAHAYVVKARGRLEELDERSLMTRTLGKLTLATALISVPLLFIGLGVLTAVIAGGGFSALLIDVSARVLGFIWHKISS